MNMIEQLTEYLGTYSGSGINHDNQGFHYQVTIGKALNGRGLNIWAKATGDDGTIYHEEESLIAHSIDGKEKMWVLMSNAPGVVEHNLLKAGSLNDSLISFVFGHGDLANESSFREEITFDLWKNGDLTHRYAWGMPGGEFKDRSGARMVRQ